MSFQPGTDDIWTSTEMQDLGELQSLTLGLNGHVSKVWSDVVLSDIHHLSISRPYQVAQNMSAWRAQTCSTHAQPWLARVLIIVLVIYNCYYQVCC